MATYLNDNRYFHTSDGWHVCMSPGDEQHRSYSGLRLVKYTLIDGIPIAGPFRTKRALLRWLDHFHELHDPRVKVHADRSYIPNELVLPEWTAIC